MAVQVSTHQFTAKDFHRMVEAGILREDDRVELLQGEIVDMPPIGPGHASGVKRLLNSSPYSWRGRSSSAYRTPSIWGSILNRSRTWRC